MKSSVVARVSEMALAHCASEPIRVPGAIQPHGWLVSLDAASGALVGYSENWSQLIDGVDVGSTYLPDRVASVVAGITFDRDELERNDGPVSLGEVRIGTHALHATAHQRGDLINIELEPQVRDLGAASPIYALTRRLLPRMQGVQTVDELCALAADEMQRITGFGRSLVYRFDEEGHGEVLAEAVTMGYDSYAGHRFPAPDIPPQARELYRVNRFRLIADANYVPVPIRFLDAARAGENFDMSLVQLRSVSPIHLEYMRNMRTLASSSVSIMVRGELWGLISCHDRAPRLLDYATRMACEHLGQLLSLQIEAKEDNARISEQATLRQLTLAMVAHLADSDATLQRLVSDPGPLLRMARAVGAAVLFDDRCWTVGRTPDPAAIVRLGDWLATRMGEEFHSHRLPIDCAEFAAHADAASGVLAISISQVHRHYLLWFRPEVVQAVQWAGDPRKSESPGDDGRLHPRLSFSTWREELRERSLPWSAGEVGAALELRQALIAIVLRRAEEMAEVAGELGRVNKELEAFSYTVSHDLRAPMRHISGYLDLVVDSEPQLGERSRRYLAHAKAASSYAGQLVDALLDFSRMGRAALQRTEVNIAALVDDLVREFSMQDGGRFIRWDVQGPLPTLWGDAILLQVAVRNLIGNAVKYSRGRNPALISIRALSTPQGEGLTITDNGVGFDMKYVGKLFGVFQRLHQSEVFEGTGIGLASVRRIVERHGGAVTALGELERGATFSFTVPRKADAPAETKPDSQPEPPTEPPTEPKETR